MRRFYSLLLNLNALALSSTVKGHRASRHCKIPAPLSRVNTTPELVTESTKTATPQQGPHVPNPTHACPTPSQPPAHAARDPARPRPGRRPRSAALSASSPAKPPLRRLLHAGGYPSLPSRHPSRRASLLVPSARRVFVASVLAFVPAPLPVLADCRPPSPPPPPGSPAARSASVPAARAGCSPRLRLRRLPLPAWPPRPTPLALPSAGSPRAEAELRPPPVHPRWRPPRDAVDCAELRSRPREDLCRAPPSPRRASCRSSAAAPGKLLCRGRGRGRVPPSAARHRRRPSTGSQRRRPRPRLVPRHHARLAAELRPLRDFGTGNHVVGPVLRSLPRAPGF
ncbi:hypothetical protein GQ55_7G128700 [Panicum hallii var. hallii]|uniref:Uncharacterized protein n=1 Tax=Panicum hallii var. hallii TaxID=1504633 RepID=A0A2T7CUI8_9POAL|nr:hypothetical protein GQ55_7G128700 [Panicum hallii var. hallii]